MNSMIGRSPGHRRAYTQNRESQFRNRRINDALWTKLFEQTARDFVGALIFGDLFAHQKHALVARQLFAQGVIQAHRAWSSQPFETSLSVAHDWIRVNVP
jgi:hypothetical protein